MLSPSLFLCNTLVYHLRTNPSHTQHSAPIFRRRAVVNTWRLHTGERGSSPASWPSSHRAWRCGHQCCWLFTLSLYPLLQSFPAQAPPVRLRVTYHLPPRLPNLHSLPACHHSFWDERGPLLRRYYGKCLCKTPCQMERNTEMKK